MVKVRVGHENSGAVELHCDDVGFGPTVVLVHGWPYGAIAWEKQTTELLSAGYRVVTCDRRGHGNSSVSTMGFDLDTLADDLNLIFTQLDLCDCALFGIGIGCADVARYIGTFGSDRLRRVAFVSATPPAGSAPDGDGLFGQRLVSGLRQDRATFLHGFVAEAFRATESPDGEGAAPYAENAHWVSAISVCAHVQLASAAIFAADYCDDLARIAAPVLVVHGDADHVSALKESAQVICEHLVDGQLVVIPGGPHAIAWTHAELVSSALIKFLQAS